LPVYSAQLNVAYGLGLFIHHLEDPGLGMITPAAVQIGLELPLIKWIGEQ
jgi:hypothetical protein